VKRFLNDVRIDLWLGGHIHSGPRQKTATVTKGATTFINVASVSHTYGTEVCNSVFLDIEKDSRQVTARCRDHDNERFMDDHEVMVGLAYPAELGKDGPVFEPFELEVPEFYRSIHDEQVDDFGRYRDAG